MSEFLGASAASPRAVFAAPQSQPVDTMPGLGSLAEVVFALLVVLALIMAVAWVARRMRIGGAEGTAIRIVAETSLGAKERAVLLQVKGRQLLVGVAAGSVTTLHVFEPGDTVETSAADTPAQSGLDSGRPSFQSLLRRSLGLR
jgi:flagellar protein FliO/FliZ